MIHLATHGRFRADNPVFGDSIGRRRYLTLYDLNRFRLPVELVTLSGCSTGVNVVAKGDELLGLVRGLLHAGARSLMLSLWDVHDHSTTELMRSFYAAVSRQTAMASGPAGAMQELRQKQPSLLLGSRSFSSAAREAAKKIILAPRYIFRHPRCS